MLGKVAIVTGGAQGIGEACARRFAAEGATVVVADIREPSWIADTGVVYRRCDVGMAEDVSDLFAAVARDHGRLDVLLNNAALLRIAPFLEQSEQDFDDVIRVGLKSVFLCSQAAGRMMVEHGTRGSIVNMASINSVVAIPTHAAYAAAKGGIVQLTRAAAVALAPHGIRVNAIGPGTIATEMARMNTLSNDAARRRMLSRTPLGRPGEPEEIASIAVFLATDASSYVTGQTIFAEGGRLALNLTMPDT
ncbi:SDR family NAD(P)-dependent oxidoreductase [Enterovirga rhinocerotis]|uniref:NAD(P)-dependent dehydrogenase (Short-subunit alcohol dehydrogenase family) n=1 Tax=Enterovirga rhinocerotis TaxID=1339210 RepID=A0A4R7C3C3_9HYPH|nr:SDR family oxidoreductase [Enterovirga rhinocerotis]TDR92924.1 NAD(P)-dependent dehydrogenase (short-subunit alcohol dehydrogenase family) [Enterovirga rhinocerotis]